MKDKQQERTKNATCGPTSGHWLDMNRKQRREMIRKIQSEDLSLEMVHPDAAGIDIGNESHYVAVPQTRDSQPVRRFGCTTAETPQVVEKSEKAKQQMEGVEASVVLRRQTLFPTELRARKLCV